MSLVNTDMELCAAYRRVMLQSIGPTQLPTLSGTDH